MDNDTDEKYILRTWITKGVIDEENNFNDRNFGCLSGYLKKMGKEVWLLPMYFNLPEGIIKETRKLSKLNINFLFPEQYISLFDYFSTYFFGLKTVFLKINKLSLNKINITKIVKNSHMRTVLSPMFLINNQSVKLLKVLSQKGIKIDSFIYPFENNALEKPFILACRKYYSHSELIGFQHSVWFKEQLGMFMIKDELKSHPLPKKIVCSGKKYIEIMKRAGFPENILYLGPNLRYEYVFEKKKSIRNNVCVGNGSILIILNFDTNQCLEVLFKVKQLLKNVETPNIVIKTHPVNDISILKKFLNDIDFPEFTWGEGTVLELIIQSQVTIMSYGSVSNLEAMILGVSLLRISLGADFDFNPLWDDYVISLNTKQNDLQKVFSLLYSPSESDQKKISNFGKRILSEYFETVSEKSLGIFLK